MVVVVASVLSVLLVDVAVVEGVVVSGGLVVPLINFSVSLSFWMLLNVLDIGWVSASPSSKCASVFPQETRAKQSRTASIIEIYLFVLLENPLDTLIASFNFRCPWQECKKQ